MVGYKAGMSHFTMMDDSEAPSKNAEVSKPCTFLEIPETTLYGARFYRRNGRSGYREAAAESYSSDYIGAAKEKPKRHQSLESLKARLPEFDDITALLVSNVKGTPTGQHHRVRFESSLGGASVEEKYSFVAGAMGKRIRPAEVFKNGEFVDVASVSKGKGWQGTIKRFGTARLSHKATQKVRHVGSLGPFTPGKVLYTVPQAGQMGFHYRNEYNKRIVRIGSGEDAKGINPRAGFQNYGLIANDFLMLSGSIPGPAKRMVRVRKSVTGRNKSGIKEPKLLYMAVNR